MQLVMGNETRQDYQNDTLTYS